MGRVRGAARRALLTSRGILAVSPSFFLPFAELFLYGGSTVRTTGDVKEKVTRFLPPPAKLAGCWFAEIRSQIPRAQGNNVSARIRNSPRR